MEANFDVLVWGHAATFRSDMGTIKIVGTGPYGLRFAIGILNKLAESPFSQAELDRIATLVTSTDQFVKEYMGGRYTPVEEGAES